MFNAIIYGDRRVGKTSLMFAYCSQELYQPEIHNMGFEFKLRKFGDLGERIQMWDMVNAYRYNTNNGYFRGVDFLILVYNITNRESF